MATTDDRSPDRPTAGRVSRGVVATGLAWSVPAVVVATAAPAMALSGVAPLFQVLAPCLNPAPACAGRPTGYGFPVRICNQDASKSVYLYSATISSPQLGDLAFGTVEPPFGTSISTNCTNVFFNAGTTTLPPATFTATISVTWGHTLPIGSDRDQAPVVLTVPVSGTPGACLCPPG